MRLGRQGKNTIIFEAVCWRQLFQSGLRSLALVGTPLCRSGKLSCRCLPAIAVVIVVFAANSGFTLPARAQSEFQTPVPAPQPVPVKNLSALQIFDATLAKFEVDRAALRQWQYHQTLITEQFDSAGKVVAKGTWHSIVRPGDPGPLEYTGKSVQGKLSFFEAGAEEPKSAPEKTSTPLPAKPSATKNKKNQAEWAIEAVRKYNLRNRYEWKRMPDGTAAGEEAYILRFTPKPKQNTSTREERFFSLLAGRMWISKRDFTVLRAEGALQSPSSLFWIIARVTTFRFTYRLEPAHGNNRLLRTSKATANTVVSFPFYKVRQKHWQTVDSYEPRTPRGSGSAPASH